MTVCESNNIAFDISGSVGKLGTRNSSICVILGNALDNAVAGCLTLDTNRQIKIVMCKDDAEQSILVTNNFDGFVKTDSDGDILSRKRDNSPGIGLYSMKELCEQNGVIIDVRYEGNNFNVLFIFPIQE